MARRSDLIPHLRADLLRLALDALEGGDGVCREQTSGPAAGGHGVLGVPANNGDGFCGRLEWEDAFVVLEEDGGVGRGAAEEGADFRSVEAFFGAVEGDVGGVGALEQAEDL